MGMMSWSDDTRCLYCEGRLPLYLKVTHGQFCSSAHRKAYWQDQERLAIERLNQTHDSLRSYRSQTQAKALEELASHPALERVQAVRTVLQDPDPVLVSNEATQFEAPQDEAPLTVPESFGLLVPQFLPRGGSWPELVAADPFEYDFARQPLPPSSPGSFPETNPLPEGHPIAGWACLAARLWTGQAASAEPAAEEEYQVALCHPRSPSPAVAMGAAGRVALPLTAGSEGGRTAGLIETSLQSLEIKPAMVTNVVLEVVPENDVLIQLLDQQVPHPDRLLTLGQFAALASAVGFACPPSEPVDTEAPTTLPAAALAAVIPDYQLSGAEMLPLPASSPLAQGSLASRGAIPELPADAQVAMSGVAMPAAEEAAYKVGTAGLQALSASLLRPAPGVFAPQTADVRALDLPAGAVSSVTLQNSAATPAVEAAGYEIGTAGLQQLSSSLVCPATGVFARSTTDSAALDLSTGVSSDVTLPGFALGAGETAVPRFAGMLPLTFGKRKLEAPRPEPIARLIPQTVEAQPVLPRLALEPLDRKPPEDALRNKGAGLGSLLRGDGLAKLEPVWAHATGFWHHAPRDLKLLLFAIPALLALVFHPGLPRVAFAAPQRTGGFSGSFQRVLNDQWGNVRQTLENRAAIALDEDFRSGLDSWASPGGSTAEWSFDATGFVRPGPLALYRPSVNLADYQVQFLGLIDKKALSWVVRAADFENFYVVKLVVLKSGPIPEIGLTRYAVIGGKAQDRHDVHIPLNARTDTLYRVRMDLRGANFSVEVQGQMADSWTESRLPRGGVGFFTARGEESRVRWVQITHQYDMLGRLCAYLAPYDTTNGSWQP